MICLNYLCLMEVLRWNGRDGCKSGRLAHIEAAFLLGACDRTLRCYMVKYDEDGLKWLLDKRLAQASHRCAPVNEVMQLTEQYQNRYSDWNAKHFHAWYRKDVSTLSYTWVKSRLQEAVGKFGFFRPPIRIEVATIGIRRKLAVRSTNIVSLSLGKPWGDSELKQLRLINPEHESVVNACFVHIKNVCRRNWYWLISPTWWQQSNIWRKYICLLLMLNLCSLQQQKDQRLFPEPVGNLRISFVSATSHGVVWFRS